VALQEGFGSMDLVTHVVRLPSDILSPPEECNLMTEAFHSRNSI
jgi:hypothetical protein